jgi:tRNA (guanine37-N1)-methyltransferase
MFFEILTLFPGMFEGAFSDSIIQRARDKGKIGIAIDDIRNYSDDVKHRTVDDAPYGGSAGMLMRPQPLAGAIRAARARRMELAPVVVFLSPQGERLTHELIVELGRERCLILVCGRYKGIDQRIRDTLIDREISIGDYVLSGGEIPAMVVVDAVTRLIPGVLGDRESAESDSFYGGLLSPPCYTRPEEWEGLTVPEVLISGHHENIRKWSLQKAKERTRCLRPDLWDAWAREHREESGEPEHSPLE